LRPGFFFSILDTFFFNWFPVIENVSYKQEWVHCRIIEVTPLFRSKLCQLIPFSLFSFIRHNRIDVDLYVCD
jgi:hypothetical protein